MEILKATVEALKAALSAFLDALVAFLSPNSPTPPPAGPPPGLIRVEVTADKALLHTKVGADDAGKPILEIWHDENGKVARFDPGTVFSVQPEPVFATGMIKFWQLYYKPQFYVQASACTKL